MVYSLNAVMDQYRGCGNAWAAIRNNQVVAIRYMDRGTANHRERTFEQHRTISRAELEARGETVVSGMCSCTEFVSAY